MGGVTSKVVGHNLLATARLNVINELLEVPLYNRLLEL